MPCWSKAPATKPVQPCLQLSSCAPRAAQEIRVPVPVAHKLLLSFGKIEVLNLPWVCRCSSPALLPAEGCHSPWPLARVRGQGSGHVTAQTSCTHPVWYSSMLKPELGLQSLILWSLALRRLTEDCSPAGNISPGDSTGFWTWRRGASLFTWKMTGMFQVAV